MSTEQKIEALYRLQCLDSKIDSINHIKGELPLEVTDLEDIASGLESRISKLQGEIEEMSRNSRGKKEDIENAKALIVKYEEQQKAVRNNREFESLGKEVEFQKLEIELCEKNIKEFSADSKLKKKLIEEIKEELAGRRIDLGHKREELASIEAETEAEIASLQASADQEAIKIDSRLLDAYHRLRSNMRNGLAVVTVKRDACGGCFNRIPPQRQLDIRQSKKIIVCEYCGRILVSDLMDDAQEQE